jgi:signal peptidase I
LRALWAAVRELLIVVGIALILSSLVRAFIFQAFYVPSASMEDTLLLEDRIIATKISKPFTDIKRGQIVVFKDPGDWLPEYESDRNPFLHLLSVVGLLPSDAGDDLVKRVIGIQGDSVKCCSENGKILINNTELIDDEFIKPGVETNQVEFEITVPQNRIFVMGDNRPDSRDSRFHLETAYGTVPVKNVVGPVQIRIWPFNRFATLGIPDAFKAIPDAQS